MPKWLIVLLIIILALAVGFLLMPKTTAPNNVGKSDEDGEQGKNEPKPDFYDKQVILETSMGRITLEFYPEDAPKAVENFIGLAKKGYYNGVTFHRVVRDFVIQTGDPTGTGRGGESFFGTVFEDELNPAAASYQTGYKKGVLAMANRGPNTNTSQFFIMLKDNPLDHLYTIFGRVIAGQEVVDKIGLVPVDPETDKPVTPVMIEEVRIVEKR